MALTQPAASRAWLRTVAAGLLIGCGLVVGAPSNASEEGEGSSRTVVLGVAVPERPKWMVPLFSGTSGNYGKDGKMVGVAIRVLGEFILAHARSALAIRDSFKDKSFISSDPALIGLGIGTSFDAFSPSTQYNYYIPIHKKTIKHSIGIYTIGIRKGAERDYSGYTANYDVPFGDDDKPPLQRSWENAVGKDCYLMSWGQATRGQYEENRDTTFNMRKIPLKDIDASAKGCPGSLCKFEMKDLKEKDSGLICGDLAVLGAPVMCPHKGKDKLMYLVSGHVANPTCGVKFEALKLIDVNEWVWNELIDLEKNQPKPFAPSAIG